MNISTALKKSIAESGKDPRFILETEILLSHALGKNRVYLRSHAEYELSSTEQQKFSSLFQRYQQGAPLAYLLQSQNFYGIDLLVTPDVLIPRSETELLVDAILAKLPSDKNFSVLDLGTGSGAIAIALATHRPTWNITATDFSAKALMVAESNIQKHKLNNILLIQSDWFTSIPEMQFDVIVSNPPYIDIDDFAVSQNVRDYEPHSALFAKQNGLADIKKLIESAKRYLRPNGFLLLEHGYEQQDLIISLLHQAGFSNIERGIDLAAWPRYIIAQ